MEVHIVHKSNGGFAKEDPEQSAILGAFTDSETARRVSLVTGGQIAVIEVDQIAPGYIESFKQLGL